MNKNNEMKQKGTKYQKNGSKEKEVKKQGNPAELLLHT